MRIPSLLLPALLLGALSPSASLAEKPAAAAPASIAQPDFLRQFAETFRFRQGRPTAIQVTPKGDAVLFLRAPARSFVQDLWSFDPATGEEKVLLTAEKILAGGQEKLTAEELARRERMRMAARGIASYSLSPDGERILVPLSGRLFVIERKSGAVKELPSDGGYPVDPRFSPDGKSVGLVRDGDLFVIDVATRKQRRLTRRENDHVTNGLAEFVAQEEMDRMEGYWFSADARFVAYEKADTSEVETSFIADPMKPQQEAEGWPYPRPGKKNAVVSLHVAPTAGGKAIEVKWDRQKYPYLATVKWAKDAPLTILVQNRTQNEEALLAVDARGATRELLVERDDAWVNLDQEMPRWLAGGKGFLWTTERNGSWQLEQRDASGKLVRAITEPGLGYQGLAHLDEKAGFAVVAASADPTQRQLVRVPLAGGKMEALTNEPALHDATYADEADVAVRTVSDRKGNARYEVVRADGSKAGELRSMAEKPGFEPNLELARLGGERDFAAAILRPRNFDPKFKYPVVVYVYAGPHAQTVVSAGDRYWLQQWIADHGFVVVSVDGRGTPNRGRAWERSIHGNLIDVPLEDQVAGLKALGAKYPEMDLDRAGIFGWSFGGYFSAMAVMRRPDVYKVGVAGAPVADWLDYDTHYTERYLGLPEANAAGYEKSSVLTYAKDLQRPLLIVHGTADDNVYFSHALKMSDALFRAGKEHDFLPLAGFTHMVPDPLVTTRLYTRITDYLAASLGTPVAR